MSLEDLQELSRTDQAIVDEARAGLAPENVASQDPAVILYCQLVELKRQICAAGERDEANGKVDHGKLRQIERILARLSDDPGEQTKPNPLADLPKPKPAVEPVRTEEVVSEVVSGVASEEVSEVASEVVSEEVSEVVSEVASEVVSEEVSEVVSEEVSEVVSEEDEEESSAPLDEETQRLDQE